MHNGEETKGHPSEIASIEGMTRNTAKACWNYNFLQG